MIRVQKEDFDIGSEISKILKSNTEIGGLSSFVGVVREYSGDDQIKTMTLEHYPGMTEKILDGLEVKAREHWELNYANDAADRWARYMSNLIETNEEGELIFEELEEAFSFGKFKV